MYNTNSDSQGSRRPRGNFKSKPSFGGEKRTYSSSPSRSTSAPRTGSTYKVDSASATGSTSRSTSAPRSGASAPRSNYGQAPRRNYSSSPRPSFGGGRGFGGGGSRGGNGGGRRFGRKAIDVSKFINKVVITEEAEVFVPVNKFADFIIDERLKATILERGYNLPTPIQDKVIPHILQGKEVVGMANTGTGKTAAFLIPLIDKVLKDKTQKVLVIVPTRELATQINDEFRIFAKGLSLFSAVCVGGAPMGAQIRDLHRTHNFVIGTPGRLKDLIERGFIRLKTFNTFVLDEADRMLDMGFVNEIKAIVKQMPLERHGLFFSATLSKEIDALIHGFLKDPLRISVKTQEISKNIEQDIVSVRREEKMGELVKLLSKDEFSKVLVFGQTKHGVEKIYEALKAQGFKVDSIHGNKTQQRRQRTLTQFKRDEINILVATDVAARGLDIKDISHVINYDTPESHEDYVHRIGRTGRGEKKGKALTFVDKY